MHRRLRALHLPLGLPSLLCRLTFERLPPHLPQDDAGRISARLAIGAHVLIACDGEFPADDLVELPLGIHLLFLLLCRCARCRRRSPLASRGLAVGL
eukprot:scaffold133270_cov93-Phaeocystis_antarctica.AAC.1